jgi:hypothetical protein
MSLLESCLGLVSTEPDGDAPGEGGVGVELAGEVASGLTDGVGVAEGVGVTEGVAEGVGVGVGVGVGCGIKA